MRIYKFYADWCGPCKVLSKKLEGFDLCELTEVNIEDEKNEHLVEEYAIRNIPAMVLVDDDCKVIKKWNGLVNVDNLKKEISQLCK